MEEVRRKWEASKSALEEAQRINGQVREDLDNEKGKVEKLEVNLKQKEAGLKTGTNLLSIFVVVVVVVFTFIKGTSVLWMTWDFLKSLNV